MVQTENRMNWLQKAGIVFLAIVMAFAFAGCSNQSDSKGEASKLDYPDAQTLLVALWEQVAEDQKPAVIGGVGDEAAADMPQALDLGQKENLEHALTVTPALVDAAESGSSLMNAMMANSFTASVWQLKEGSDLKALVEEEGKKMQDNQWICSFPDEYAVYGKDNFIVVCYGLTDQVKPFEEAVEKTLTNAETVKGQFAE